MAILVFSLSPKEQQKLGKPCYHIQDSLKHQIVAREAEVGEMGQKWVERGKKR